MFHENEFSIGELSDSQYEENKERAYLRFRNGEEPSFSGGICGTVTAGYGRLDLYGYWEFPLDVDQDTLNILPHKDI